MLTPWRMQRPEFDPGIALQAGLLGLFSKEMFFCEHSEKTPRQSPLADCCSSQDNKPKGNWYCLALQMGNVDISSVCLTADSWHSLWEIILGRKETFQTPLLPLPQAPLSSLWVLRITPPGMSLPQSWLLHPFLGIHTFLQPFPPAGPKDQGVGSEQIFGDYNGVQLSWHQWGQAATSQPRCG